MNKPVQFITTPSGERLVVIPEAEYELLLAAAEDDEGEISDDFAQELLRRREAVERGDYIASKQGVAR